MQALLDVILPVFLVIGLGYAVAWRGWFTEKSVDGLMTFAQSFAVPCLLFRSIARLDLAANYDSGLLLSFYIGAFSGFVLGFAGARFGFKRPLTDSVTIGFCCLFSNSLLLGLPITERAYGEAALAGNYAIISIHSPLLFTFGIIAMQVARSRELGIVKEGMLVRILGEIARNPLVIGIVLGFLVNVTGNPLPGPAWAAVDMMARSALPAALFGLGGVLFRYRPEGDLKAIVMVCVISLIIHPAITLGLGRHGFGLNLDQLRSATLTAAMAPGVNAYVYANLYGSARRVAASAVLVATGLSVFTIWFWLAILA